MIAQASCRPRRALAHCPGVERVLVGGDRRHGPGPSASLSAAPSPMASRIAGVPASNRCGVGRRIVIGVHGDRADHLAPALVGRQGGQRARPCRRGADAGRAVELVAGEDVEVAAQRLRRPPRSCTTAWQPSSSTGAPTARAASTTGAHVQRAAPVTLDMWVSATMRVRGRSGARGRASRSSAPSSRTGTNRSTTPLPLAQEVPGHDVGVMLKLRHHDLVARLERAGRATRRRG